MAGIGAFAFLRTEIGSYPLHRIEAGAWLALAAGAGLLLVGLARLRAAARR